MLRLASPFLVLAASATLAAQNHWYVDPAGNDANAGTSAAAPFRTVMHAAGVASSGDVLHLAAATFGDEQGNIVLGTKDLTLVGAGIGVTVVRSHSTSDVVLPAGTLATPVAEAHRPVITLQGTARVDLRDMTLDNNFVLPSTGRAHGLWVGSGADTVCHRVEFANARQAVIGGFQGPVAVYARGDNAADCSTVELRSCHVHDFEKGGVVANFNAHLAMDDCRVDGSGHAALGLAAQNGIQVSRGASCEIRRTTVTDCWYEPPSTVATGMLLYDASSPVLVEDCSFGNCQVGIYVFGTAAGSLAGEFRRNRVHAAEYGFYTDNISGMTIADNSFAVSLAGDVNDAWDDAGGNAWSGNFYSSIAAAGPHLLPGSGGVTDATAKPTCRFLGAPIATPLPAGHAPVDLAAGDLDGDGDPDVATLTQTATTPALVIANNAGGTFTTTTLPFGNANGRPVQLVLGQFDGAPGLDVAALTVTVPPATTENAVYVFANDGAGNFALLHTHVLAGAVAASGIAAGDVDGDGRADLAVTDAGSAGFVAGSAAVLRNNGSGTGFVAVPLPGGFTTACRGAAIADLDGDTDADVAVTEGNATSGRLHLFAGDGAGAFAPFASSPLATAVNSNRVLATDLEGDGDRDLLVSSTRDAFGLVPGAVEVFENAGAAAFARSEYRVDRGPGALAAGDFDDDDDPDSQRRDAAVVNLAAGTVTVLGTWTSGAGYGSGGVCVRGVVATCVAIADVDGNGFQDLVYGDAAGAIAVLPGVTQARADYYGTGCPGRHARVPFITPVGIPALPVQPNATFGLGLTNAQPLSVAVFALGLAPAPTLTPCSLLVANIGATWVVLTDAIGRAAVPLPIPASPVVIGLPLFAQAGVFDAAASTSFFPGVALTQGMKVRIGN